MFNEMQLTVFTLLVFACCVVSRKSLKSQCIGKITTQQAKTSKVNTVSCILCILCNMDLLVRSVDTFYKIRITSEKLTSLCFNLYFVSIFPFTNILLMAISPSPLLFPFFVCYHYYHHSGNSMETPLGHEKSFHFWSWPFTRTVLSMGACPTTNNHRKCKQPVS